MKNWSFLRGGGQKGRHTRYAITLIVGVVIILSLAAAIYIFTPRSYSSGFTLILPGAGASSSVSIETLGQTSTNAASAYGSQSLSPTENYKKLLQSYRLRGRVAEQFDLPLADVPPPRIRLANQTQLIYVSLTADSPDKVKAFADAWLSVFDSEISALRMEEQVIRENAYRSTLLGFEEAVEQSRARIIAFQTEHGLISVEQFQNLVQRSETMKLQARDARTKADVAEHEIGRLSGMLGVSPDRAAKVMMLQSDPMFQSLYASLSEAENRRAELANMYGANHPELRVATEEKAGLQAALDERGQKLIGFERFESIEVGQYAANTERARLISGLVRAATSYAGARQELEALQIQQAETIARVKLLAEPATELDALLRDHQVAETVFASALARIDTNRTDMFASYPLTQTVEHPGLPSAPVTPSKQLVAIGTIGVIFLYSMGLILLWIRLPIIRLLLKTV